MCVIAPTCLMLVVRDSCRGLSVSIHIYQYDRTPAMLARTPEMHIKLCANARTPYAKVKSCVKFPYLAGSCWRGVNTVKAVETSHGIS